MHGIPKLYWGNWWDPEAYFLPELGIRVYKQKGVHDAKIFQNSALFALINKRVCLKIIMDVNGVTIALIILGDWSYPLLSWLI